MSMPRTPDESDSGRIVPHGLFPRFSPGEFGNSLDGFVILSAAMIRPERSSRGMHSSGEVVLVITRAVFVLILATSVGCGRPPRAADHIWVRSQKTPLPQPTDGRRLVVEKAPFSMFVPRGLVQVAQGNGFREMCDDVGVSVVPVRAPGESDFSRPHSLLPPRWSVVRTHETSWQLNGTQLVLELVQDLAHDPPMQAWVVATPVADRVYIWTAAYPISLAGKYSAKLKTALGSILVDTSPRTEPVEFDLDALGLVPVADFRNVRHFIRDGSACPPPLDSPILQVRVLTEALAVRDQRSASSRFLRGMGARQVVQTDRVIRIDNLDGIESFASGRDLAREGTVLVYQAMLFDVGRTFLIQGRVALDYQDSRTWWARFADSARTFHRLKRRPEMLSGAAELKVEADEGP
jgi:hypothetical protein